MRIAIANDHTAGELKMELLLHLQGKPGITVDYLGNGEYPDYAGIVAKSIASGQHDLGLLLCGTGAGMCIAANKVRGIRAAVCSEPFTAKLTRQHNNANILCLGARVVGTELAKMIVDAFIEAEFEGGRHATRVDKFMAFEVN